MQTYPRPKSKSFALLMFGSQIEKLSLDFECRAASQFGMIWHLFRCAKKCHDSVTDELVECAPKVGFNNVRNQLEIIPKLLDDLRRAKVLADRREIGDV